MISKWIAALGAFVALGGGTWALVAAPRERCLADFSTSLKARSRNQRHNALLACQKLDGALIAPGETFSFNERVGSFSQDGGYRKAPVSYNGQLIDSFGGGVCQTSTTCYNAALRAGFGIVERNRHRFAPNYVSPGLDAAVAYYTIDLKLKNSYAFPVKIRARIDNDVLRVGFYGEGQPLPVELESKVRQVRLPTLFEIGDRRQAGRMRNSGKSGYSVQVYRMIGGQRELISSDNYPVMDKVVDRR